MVSEVIQSRQTTTVAVIANLQQGSDPAVPDNPAMTDFVLVRLVRRLNRLIQPDVALVLGDVVGSGPGDPEERRAVPPDTLWRHRGAWNRSGANPTVRS